MGAQITGADIDAENIAWCQANLHGGRFLTAPLWPPLDLPDACFDAVIGLSVMTHLTAEAQRAWLGEIRRILKPGGVALISFGGDGAASFASFHHTPAWWARWRATGFDDGLADPALAGKIADAEYYRVTHQTARQARGGVVRGDAGGGDRAAGVRVSGYRGFPPGLAVSAGVTEGASGGRGFAPGPHQGQVLGTCLSAPPS